MKTTIYSLALAAVTCSLAAAQTTAFTTPVGYVTVPLLTGFNNVGLTVQPPTKAAGTLDVISASSVQDTTAGTNFLTSLGPVSVLHVLEITSGPALGVVSEISSWTADTITTVDNLVLAGVVAGNEYRIRKAPTLEEIFTTNLVGGPLTPGNATTADIVYVPTSTPGAYTQYFLSTAGAFRRVAPAGATPNVPLVYLDGLFVQRRNASPGSLVVSGEVKKDNVKSGLVTGFNYIGTVFPVGSTIQNSGLESSLLAGNATTADIIFVPTAVPGQYTQIFRSTAATWRTVAPAGVAPTTALNGAVFIQRRGGPTTYTLNAPPSYSGL